MGNSKIPTLISTSLVWLLLIAPCVAQGQSGNWQTYTSLSEVRRMAVVGDSVYMATSGGMLVVGDPDEPGTVYHNTDGLGTVDITDIAIDNNGDMWVTGDGMLVRMSDSEMRRYPISAVYGDLRLLAVEDDGDRLWIGSDSGLVLFLKDVDGGQFQNRFRITLVNQFPAVYDIALQGDSIWLATAIGIAVADRTDPVQLASPNSWTLYTTTSHPILGNNVMNRIALFEDAIHIGGAAGLFLLDTTGGTATFDRNPIIGTRAVTDLAINNDTLFAYSSAGITALADSQSALIPLGTIPGIPVTGASAGTLRWLATATREIYSYDGSFEQYPYTGMPDNEVVGLAVDGGGVLWTQLSNIGSARLIGDTWDLVEYSLGVRNTKMTVDARGHVWIGTFGAGAYRVGDSLTRYDETNTSLQVDANGDVVISGMTPYRDYIVLSSLNPMGGFPVSFCHLDSLDIPSAWKNLGSADGITNNTIINLAEGPGVIAVASDAAGVFVCDPLDAEATCKHFTEDDNFLLSDNTRVPAYALDGALWLGTNFGLSRLRIELGLDRFGDIDLPSGFGPEITALTFDGLGNVWVGARNGLVRIDSETDLVDLYTSTNSGLVDDVVNALMIHPVTGDLYVATANGLSRLDSRTGPPTDDPDEVLAFPNPYVVRSASDRVSFNFARPGTISIYTAAGERVRTITVGELWDGTNESGSDVVSGVYLFVVQDEEGKVGRGKLLLVRE